ncbi:MAG: AAA family ATPase [Minisyncoccia bacterium]
MRLKSLEINGFKSFAKKTPLEFLSPVVSVVGPNGSGKSNVVEAFRFVLGEQSMKSMRGKTGTDLIFKGSKNLSKGTRAVVSIFFDNKDKVFKLENEVGENINLNYDTISISREVYADGLNKYILNGSEVRLKDINNLLASVNIGSSGHHIISQGEADRILNASPRDRREMIEDALGLKIYQYKIKDSERKLERTTNNMKEVSLIRKEITPHLNFLKRQVEKFEKAKEMKVDLSNLYREYLKKESFYLDTQKSELHSEKNKIQTEMAELASKISSIEDTGMVQENPKNEELRNFDRKIYEIRSLKGELDRKLGRIEGMIEMEERRVKKAPQQVHVVSHEEVIKIVGEVNNYIDEALDKDSLAEVSAILSRIKIILNKFNQTPEPLENISNSEEMDNLKNTQAGVFAEIQNIQNEENKINQQAANLRREIDSENEDTRIKEREKFNYKVKQQELSASLNIILVKEDSLSRRSEAFENEIKEGAALIGVDVLSYKNFEISGSVDEYAQDEQKRKIERIKIKLEDAGLGGGSEILKEYNEVSDRDKFLAKEMEDLAVSIDSLRKLMLDLKEKIDITFKEGVKKINTEFQEFFSLMFGGGSAFLAVVAEQKRKKNNKGEPNEVEDDFDEENENGIIFEHGIEINVSLPHKKVKELQALSGGERSLTSIALLFSMSQVNPPPFLVLDETDAALDESNSRKYGDMLEKLSKHSQLVVITHNRETMSRAGVLYGVTIGADGASKLLSIKFDEAQAIAK